MSSTLRILVIGVTRSYTLEASYAAAATELGHHVKLFDVETAGAKYVRLSKVGETLHRFLPVRAWTQKLNRDMVITAKIFAPNVILYFTSAPVLFGTLATIRTILPSVKIVWIWPDTPMHLPEHSLGTGRLVDLTATYSRTSVDSFQRLGFNNVQWIPLAGDPSIHLNSPPASDNFDRDISFVGGWRPEREAVMKALLQRFPGKRLEIYGPSWKDCRDIALRRVVAGDVLRGPQMAQYFSRSRININRIDNTNYPAANMRFFEIPIAGGLQLSSACPEMSMSYKQREHVVYFDDDLDACNQVEWILANPDEARRIRVAGHDLTRRQNTYAARFQQILIEATKA